MFPLNFAAQLSFCSILFFFIIGNMESESLQNDNLIMTQSKNNNNNIIVVDIIFIYNNMIMN